MWAPSGLQGRRSSSCPAIPISHTAPIVPTRLMGHPSSPPNVCELLSALDHRAVEYVVVGSVAALIHGVELEPGDLDVVPATDPNNLESLASALWDLEARPLGPFGSWAIEASGRWKWLPRATTDHELAMWAPEIRNPESFDHRYGTRWGDLDIVPALAGTYEALRPTALRRRYLANEIWVVDVQRLLDRLDIAAREKDHARIVTLRHLLGQDGT